MSDLQKLSSTFASQDDASGSTDRAYLKRRVHRYTFAYVLVGVATIVWLGLGMPTGWAQLKDVPPPIGLVSVLMLVASIVVAAIEDLPGPDAKAVLIFWRRRNPLPGCRAFDKSNLDRDTRINQDRLRQVVGGKFPRTARDQNSTWYALHKSLAKDVTVQAMHFGYLAFRDLAWLSIVLAVLALLSVALHPQSVVRLAVSSGAFLVAYLVFRGAAMKRGHRFVNQVLVTVSVAPVKLPKK